ncbi:hypothetical protein EV198_1979 [Roseivirga ehrenbergii]|uniref:Uncharacterized protein n=1 Tax=Roseivirga ehrenbergii (strain DSM 102268 / JCM 13514 / KCTC 12282 / NCIMB 14502 / KMM 6017) TaxID=279360 RepID=A0A150WZ50_ROSEK|nr:hypothetical protein [Roseivirga ehrenbergii]KYG71759.1 hypothetical protein MB14_10615 [Roseivirga ehrenbergii]TCL07546.1 hypothetical protein EV198_1979 [Roseivirga ehrenbergii]
MKKKIELFKEKGDFCVKHEEGVMKSMTFITSRFNAVMFIIEDVQGVDVVYHGDGELIEAFCLPSAGGSNGVLTLESSGPFKIISLG